MVLATVSNNSYLAFIYMYLTLISNDDARGFSPSISQIILRFTVEISATNKFSGFRSSKGSAKLLVSRSQPL